jgi:CPA1 family monovalent cation:H+ antiporter
VAEFVLNGLAFILIGLQLPIILGRLRALSVGELLVYAAAVTGAVVVIRLVWTFFGAYLPFAFAGVRSRERVPPWQSVAVTAWSGMYGAVSLAAALSTPSDVPGRDLVVFLAFSVILATLLLKGLSLPSLVRVLGLGGGDGGERHEEKLARFKALAAAEARLQELEDADWVHDGHVSYLRGYLTKRRRGIETRFGVTLVAPEDGTGRRFELADGTELEAQRERHESMRRLRLEVLSAERREVVRLRNQGAISDDVMHRIERDFDLEDLRLAEEPV